MRQNQKMSRKAYFDENANSWDERFCNPKLSSFLDKFVPQFGLTSGQNVLDVGTGTGVLIPYLIREVGPKGSVTAVDYSEKMVQVCKTKHSHLKNVRVELKNIEKDVFPTESFDAVVCFGIFPHLENKAKVLQNINHTLKPCRKLVIAHALSSEELKAHHKDASSTVMNDILPKKAEMTQLLEQTGFTQIRIKDKPGLYLCIAHKA
jgi:ubiquinone/menaquinone biosynthesis C-methylase UbiE